MPAKERSTRQQNNFSRFLTLHMNYAKKDRKSNFEDFSTDGTKKQYKQHIFKSLPTFALFPFIDVFFWHHKAATHHHRAWKINGILILCLTF
jgi:hypothetical protein